jgi:exopolysaccharide biosynthesis protein
VTLAGVPMKVVQVDPRRDNVRLAVVTPRKGVGYLDSWSRMIQRTRPAAAVTGTYFDTSTALPIGLIRVAGKTVYRGGIGTAFLVRNGKGARIQTCKPGIGYRFKGYDTVLRAGPRLLTRGKRTLYPRSEGFRDPAVFARKPRTAIGIRRDGKVLLVVVRKPVQLRTLAAALRRLGAVDAMCLDGGGSTGLYYRGKSHVQPSRALTNLLVVYDSSQRYRKMAKRLNPRSSRLARAN